MYGDVDAPCLYPGDDVVDIIGVSFFEGKGDGCYHQQVRKHESESTQTVICYTLTNHSLE